MDFDSYVDFFLEVIDKGSYEVVCARIDTHSSGKVASKKIHDVLNITTMPLESSRKSSC